MAQKLMKNRLAFERGQADIVALHISNSESWFWISTGICYMGQIKEVYAADSDGGKKDNAQDDFFECAHNSTSLSKF